MKGHLKATSIFYISHNIFHHINGGYQALRHFEYVACKRFFFFHDRVRQDCKILPFGRLLIRKKGIQKISDNEFQDLAKIRRTISVVLGGFSPISEMDVFFFSHSPKQFETNEQIVDIFQTSDKCLDICISTFHQTILSLNVPEEETLGKHCGKRRKCW